MRKVTIKGSCAKQFDKVRRVFIENFRTRGEVGASLCIYFKGQQVVNLWGGDAVSSDDKKDPHREWSADTLTNVYSCSKGVAASCVLLLADRGLLRYEDPVSKHWPEFAQNGKEHITIAQLMSHQSGLTHFDVKVNLELIARAQNVDLDTGKPIFDLNNAAQREEAAKARSLLSGILASTTPKWTAKGKFGYHAFSIGLFVSELITRVDPLHRTLRVFFNEEIARPLDLDFHFGIAQAEVAKRCAKLYTVPERDPSSPAEVLADCADSSERITAPELSDAERKHIRTKIGEQPKWDFEAFQANLGDPSSPTFGAFTASRFLEISSGTGFGNAQALARLYSEMALAHGTSEAASAQRASLFQNSAVVRKALSKAVEGTDCVLMTKTALANAGYMLRLDFPGAFCHSGNGGSLGLGDWQYQIGFGYSPNGISTGGEEVARRQALMMALYECLEPQSFPQSTRSKL